MPVQLPYSDLLPHFGATHHWPLTSTQPFNDEALGGADLTLNDSSGMAAQDYKLFAEVPAMYPAHTSGYGYNKTSLQNLSAHVQNEGITSWTVQFWVAGKNGNSNIDLLTDLGGENYHRPSFNDRPDKGHLITLMFDETTTDLDAWVDDQFWKTIETGGTADGYSVIHLCENREEVSIGHVAFFPKTLTASEIDTIYTQRLFLGKIEGTMTVDGAGSAGTIRAFARSNGDLSGETTAASDGSYIVYVTDPTEVDVLAIPPDGVAARPLAHGPILPINAES